MAKVKKGKKQESIECGYHQIPQAGKKSKTGEDAIFISKEKTCFGIFDGVGGWKKEGVDASLYSSKLSEATQEAFDRDNIQDPIQIMHYACEQAQDIRGSSTACIVVLNGNQLVAANLGDSRFIVVRDQKIVLSSRDQEIEWNMPYQIGTESNCFPKTHAEVYTFSLKMGDYIVLGSDGLFDNLSHAEIIPFLKGNSCKAEAKKIVEKAFSVSCDQRKSTPFSKEAKKVGKNWSGGKQDDISVIVVRFNGES